MTLMITVGELNKIACAQLDRFEVEFNDIPMYMSGYNPKLQTQKAFK